MSGKTSPERREFLRIHLSEPFDFRVCETSDKTDPSEDSAARAVTRNVSQSGIFFQTDSHPPALSSILWMKLDFRALNICQEIEHRALVVNDGVLGRVVRLEENQKKDHVYDVGVCFLTREERASREVSRLLKKLSP
jgi:hypothetical protein